MSSDYGTASVAILCVARPGGCYLAWNEARERACGWAIAIPRWHPTLKLFPLLPGWLLLEFCLEIRGTWNDVTNFRSGADGLAF